jgi:hypothetical protein
MDCFLFPVLVRLIFSPMIKACVFFNTPTWKQKKASFVLSRTCRRIYFTLSYLTISDGEKKNKELQWQMQEMIRWVDRLHNSHFFYKNHVFIIEMNSHLITLIIFFLIKLGNYCSFSHYKFFTILNHFRLGIMHNVSLLFPE